MATITVSNLQKSFGAFQAIKGINLDVRDQEFTVLLGASGCGKTTLLRIIAGLEFQTSGHVHIAGRDVTDLPPRKRGIAMVFQNYAVFPHLTVSDNIAFGLKMKDLDKRQIADKVGRVAELMHINQYLDRYPAKLSGGQRQRVSVARALAVEPEVLLMDEPLSNLDALLRLEMRAELKGLLRQSKTTAIYVTHDQVEAMSLADRIAVLDQGRLVQYDTPMEVYQNPATVMVGGFIGNPPMNFLRLPVVDGRNIRLPSYTMELPAHCENEVLLGIRPEEIDIVADSGLPATIRVVEPLGPHVQLTADFHGQTVRVTTATDHQYYPGQALNLKPRAGKIRWFDPNGGTSLCRSVGSPMTVSNVKRGVSI